MHISLDTIVNKMEQQIKLAKEHRDDRETLRLHVANVKMLAELILEENSAENEIKEKLLAQENEQVKLNESVQRSDESPYEDDGTSIFDF